MGPVFPGIVLGLAETPPVSQGVSVISGGIARDLNTSHAAMGTGNKTMTALALPGLSGLQRPDTEHRLLR